MQPNQVTETLVGLTRHEREAQFTSGEQPDQPLRVTPAGLHPVTRRPRDRPRRHDPHIQPTLLGDPHQSEPRRPGLIHRRDRPVQLLQEHRHHPRRLTAQPLHTQLTRARIEHRRDRLRLVNIKPNKSHTL
jgi:hypothetical protein